MSDKPLTEMSDDEIIEALRLLRERRSTARDRRPAVGEVKREKKSKDGASQITGSLGEALGGIFDDEPKPQEVLDDIFGEEDK